MFKSEYKIEGEEKGIKIMDTLSNLFKKVKNTLYLCETYQLPTNDVVRVNISSMPLSYAALGAGNLLDLLKF